MENRKANFIRRGVSFSPYVDNIAQKTAEKEFSGNLSAFIAHAVLHYVRCQRCTVRNDFNIDINDFKGNNSGVINQSNTK